MVEMSLENNDIPHSSKKNSPFWRILAIISAALVLVCSGCGTDTSGVSPTATPSATTIEIPVATFATEQPTPMPTPTSVPLSKATHGKPHIGGPLSDFVGKYGMPEYGSDGQYNFVADSNGTIVSANIKGTPPNIVNYISVVASMDWSKDKTMTFCFQYLPDDATLIVHDPDNNWLYDSSSLGRIDLLYGSSSCVFNLMSARS